MKAKSAPALFQLSIPLRIWVICQPLSLDRARHLLWSSGSMANVSPLSGCLPMVLMIPFFVAFYRLLMVSIELRHAPFGLWIQDLSTYDPYFVLPIMMGVTQIAIQKMSPQTSADPMQAKIMMLMPVMFMFILAWAPAGLVLYWFANNLVSIGQQTFTNRMMKDGTAAAGGVKSGGKSKKSKKQGAGGRS